MMFFSVYTSSTVGIPFSLKKIWIFNAIRQRKSIRLLFFACQVPTSRDCEKKTDDGLLFIVQFFGVF